MEDIVVYNLSKKSFEEEKVYGGYWLQLFYNNTLLRKVVSKPLVQRLVSQGLGFWKNTVFSSKEISAFVKEFKIPLDDYVVPPKGYRSFNEFFIRHFRTGLRNFPHRESDLGAAAEGRLTAIRITGSEIPLNIKGQKLSLAKLLGGGDLASDYLGGWLFVFRLCPVDYHRFHFFDDGLAGDSLLIDGELHSVNPFALSAIPEVFLKNERRICAFESKNFGKVLMLEVGALGVGRIVQTYRPGSHVLRGQEKGYFSFGGSTTLLLFKTDQLQPLPEILEKNKEGHEVYVQLGETIATK